MRFLLQNFHRFAFRLAALLWAFLLFAGKLPAQIPSDTNVDDWGKNPLQFKFDIRSLNLNSLNLKGIDYVE